MRTAYDNVLLSPQTPVDTVAKSSKEGDAGNAGTEQRQPPQQQDRQAPTATDDRQEPEMEEPIIPQSPPHVQGPPVNDPQVGGGLQHDKLPEGLHPFHDGAGSPPPPAKGNKDLVVTPDSLPGTQTMLRLYLGCCRALPRNLVTLLSNQILTNQSDKKLVLVI